MKRISSTLLLFIFISLASCDKDGQFEQRRIDTINKDIEFLDSYYSETYSKGKSININNNTMKVTEILGVNQKTPIGYTVTNITNKKLLYFVDVNITNNTLTSIDFKNNSKETFPLNGFFKNQKIKNTDDFSFINILKNIDDSVSKRKFWGWSCGPCSSGFPRNFKTCCHYIFWIQNGCEQRNC
jgi:hypothetical protein